MVTAVSDEMEVDPYPTIGSRITKLREDQGLTKTAAAKLSASERHAWNSWELGRYQPQAASLAKIAKGLDLTPAGLWWLVMGGEKL